MKAVAFVRPGVMELREMAEPVAGQGQVVVRVAYCGLCGSDLHEYTSEAPSLRQAGFFQPVMGHEFTGTVSALGPGAEGIRAGDPVVVHPGGPCGACWYCQHGRPNLCLEQFTTGYREQGGYAEYVAVQASQIHPLPDGSWLKAAALTEPLAVALHAANRGGLRPGESVFIAGAGPIGLLAVIAARRKGAGLVIVSEPAESRRELALEFGADYAVDPRQSAPLRARELTKSLGTDLAIECGGIAATMDDAMAAIRRGGRVVVTGTHDTPYPVSLLPFMVQEQTIMGTMGYVEEFPQARDLIVSGEVDVSPLVSRTISLEDLPEAFAQLARDRSSDLKVLVAP